MEFLDLYKIRIIDIIDIVLVAFLLYYLYKLVKGTVAINIFVGIVILYGVWKLTELLQMELFSKILGGFLGVGMFALIVVFQQEIRKFLLMLGSTNFNARKRFFRRFKLSSKETHTLHNTKAIVDACRKMSKTKTGALIVIQRNNSLDFVKNTGDVMHAEVNRPIIESIFFKNSPLHDGAMIIEDNTITATRVILPVSNDRRIPQRFGLRHRAAVGITEKTDAVCLVVSEENGQISYLKEGDFVLFEDLEELKNQLETDVTQ
ncbi:diadenylate cyclase CdaA [Altibacter sp. HG106]|uniref:diadenylate cyclase CdaA n=1 Tax=Altibacter sp. HG106 TaxID=3023937 RepID=UPI002350DCE5|nr:diadenylate cyclase CdaA [Altibacter sp. HG106]MDC7995824.1 diadenylate cyclase CdaA [Altibacter sp. HG106]